MNSKRLHLVLLAIIVLLLVGLVGSAYGINSLLAKKADRLTAQKAKSEALSQEQLALVKAKKDIAKYSELEKITRTVVPEDKNQAEAVREIVNIAANNNVNLASITFPASTLGGGTTGVSGTTLPTPAAPGAGSSKGLSQLQPVKNIPGVYQLVIIVTSDTNRPVSYANFVQFLSDLEHNRRTAQVSSITLQPDITNRNNLTFNLTLTEYIKP
jgi:cell division protein FtsL